MTTGSQQCRFQVPKSSLAHSSWTLGAHTSLQSLSSWPNTQYCSNQWLPLSRRQNYLIMITVCCQIFQLLFCCWNLGISHFPNLGMILYPGMGNDFGKNKQKKTLLNLEGPGDMPSAEFPLKCENQCNFRLSRDHFYKTSFFIWTATNWNHLSNNEVKAPTPQDYKQLITTPSTVQLLCALFCHCIWNRSWELHAQTPHVFQRLVPSFLEDRRRLEYTVLLNTLSNSIPHQTKMRNGQKQTKITWRNIKSVT